MLFISYINISPGFILILYSSQDKQLKTYFLKYSNVYDDVTYFDIHGFMKNTKI